MRTGVAAGHRGYLHEAACYGSDEEFLAIVVPFVEGGLEAGEPTLVALGRRNAELLRGAVADTPGLSVLSGSANYARPASAIRYYRETLAAHVAAGAEQIRIVGDVPHPGVGAPWDWWGRYEAAVNHAFAEFPLWGLCPYDTRITPEPVLAEVARTHSHVVTADGRHAVNAAYEDPAGFLARRRPAPWDPLEGLPPSIELIDPVPAAARDAVRAAGRSSLLDVCEIDDLMIAVSEVVTNAFVHGRPPVRLRLWATVDRVVAAVSDGGGGPVDPFAGLLPTTDTRSGGLGLWIAHQLCSHVTFERDGSGFTIRLVAGAPHVA